MKGPAQPGPFTVLRLEESVQPVRLEKYTAQSNYRVLRAIYERALGNPRSMELELAAEHADQCGGMSCSIR